MKNNKFKVILTTIVVLLVILIGYIVFRVLNDKNKLTVEERNWINANTQSVLNVNVLNDAYVLGNNGTGVFYDFLNDFSEEYDLKINPITFTHEVVKEGVAFNVKTTLTDNDIPFYTDHYVVISKTSERIVSGSSLNGKLVGILNVDANQLANYIDLNVEYVQYEDKTLMFDAFNNGEVNYLVLPLNLYLGDILANNYEIVYHFSDVSYYYVLTLGNDIFSSIVKKYYNNWKNFDKYYNEEELSLFQEKLSISDSEMESIKSKVFSYGFVNTSPYEVIKGGSFGGINAVVLKKFSDFSNAEFNFVKYSNFDKFNKAISNGNIDIYFNRYTLNNDWLSTDGVFNISYSIIARRNNNLSINSLKSLKGKTIYVEENSLLFSFLTSILDVKINTYSSEKDLLKLNKKDVIVLIDSNIYNYYANTKLDNYTSRYSGTVNNSYSFKINNNAVLNKLLNKYISTLDKNVLITEGLQNHYKTVHTGVVLTTLAKYILYLILAFVVVLLILIKKTKKIYIAKKIKKDDKLKFIDQLTSLKNRNYLNECLDTWNNNTIYPQTIIVMDLNNLQEINDLEGYNEGDKQIKACANILIKTQLDNSEVMRTDGNEFVIYLVGYSQKQVTNYIHKLNKEMDHLPYKKGAEFGYSMILDDIKTIEDALNESVEVMKKQKKGKKNETKD